MTNPLLSLNSFGTSLNVAVVGATGGLGSAILNAFAEHPSVAKIFALSRTKLTQHPETVQWVKLDLLDEKTIEEAINEVTGSVGELHLVIVATGILHNNGNLAPEKTWRAMDASGLEMAYRINAIGPALVAKHFLPLLAKDRKSAFAAISARVGSIGDNRLGGWYAYRASKAALNMMIQTLSIELRRQNKSALCVGLHPGTVDTRLSEPFQNNVPDGKLFSPAQSANYLLEVLDNLTATDSGGVYAWDGQRIPN